MIYTSQSCKNRCLYDLWHCQMCTFMNESGTHVCSICDTQRSVSSTSSKSSTSSRSEEQIICKNWFNQVTRFLGENQIVASNSAGEGGSSQSNASSRTVRNEDGAEYDPLDISDYESLGSGWSEVTNVTKSSSADRLTRFERLRSSMTEQDKIGLGMLSLAEDG